MDPIAALQVYMNKTEHIRKLVHDHPVFLSVTNPPKALSSRRIAKILGDSIKLAGLQDKGYTVKSFNPT